MIVKRQHDFCAAHRIVGHGGKCGRLHGHNYRVTFHIEGDIQENGMVVDFAEIKNSLCAWVDDNWDHSTLLWIEDPLLQVRVMNDIYEWAASVFVCPFNPTAENMAIYLLHHLKPQKGKLVRVDLQETEKCSVTALAKKDDEA